MTGRPLTDSELESIDALMDELVPRIEAGRIHARPRFHVRWRHGIAFAAAVLLWGFVGLAVVLWR